MQILTTSATLYEAGNQRKAPSNYAILKSEDSVLSKSRSFLGGIKCQLFYQQLIFLFYLLLFVLFVLFFFLYGLKYFVKYSVR